MDENQVDEISIVGHGNVNEKERNKMVFDQIADQVSIDRSQVFHLVDRCISQFSAPLASTVFYGT